MIRITDYQISLIRDLAAPLPRWQRSEFLERVAARLTGRAIGDGVLYRTALQVQREMLGAGDNVLRA